MATPLLGSAANNPIEELLKPSETSKLGIAELSQPPTTAVQIGLFNILKRAGIKPAFVIGHSSGEIAAAYACGSLSMEAAIIISYYPGIVTMYQSRDGAMVAVELSPEIARQYLQGKLEVACENSPNSITVSGDRSEILGVIDKAKADLPDSMVRLLKVNMAYHSCEFHSSFFLLTLSRPHAGAGRSIRRPSAFKSRHVGLVAQQREHNSDIDSHRIRHATRHHLRPGVLKSEPRPTSEILDCRWYSSCI
jgi:malonyl CoA-acyl carrier protein transacylase